ncbi:exo-alpha-sialidase [soil metagenome]
MHTKLLVGTSKGLIILSNEKSWSISSVQFEGFSISLVYVDERTNTWWVGVSHRHWGEKLHRSEDEGKTWKEISVPTYIDHLYSPGEPAFLRKMWVLQHAGVDRPGGLWLGTEPGGLFFTNDNGNSFQLNESLWNHPSRQDSKQWFGAGKDYPFIHSIVIDPRDSNHIYIAVSCAGIFETLDGGKSWNARNTGLIAAYLPNPQAEVGHDPHRLLLCAKTPDVLWQQNHCGIFRSVNGASSWEEVSGADGFPKYGFALAVDENDPLTAWVIPAHSDEQRIPVGLKVAVCKTTDGGKTWRSVSKGLPNSNAFDLTLRHSFVKKESTLVFGTNNGNLYLSTDKGESWETISMNLPMINYIAFA